jgi:hypothetical protein
VKGKWVAGLAVAGVAAFAWWQSGSPEAAVDPKAAASVSGVASGPSAGSVFGAAPGSALMRPVSSAAVARAPARVSLASEIDNATSLKAIYDRLASSAEGQTAEGQYALYRILRACANVSDRRGPRPRTAVDDKRREMITALPDTDPNKAKRLAALDQLAEDRCLGLGGIVTTEAELAKRLGDAVAAGSPNAKAFQIEQEMWIERRAAASEGARRGYVAPTLNDGQIESLRTALGSKDPEAMITAGRILSTTFRDVSVRMGPDQSTVEGRALNNAFTMLACEYGYPCGDNNLRILNGCAYEGHCAAGNLPDYLYYYGSTPNESALQDQYRNLIRNAIETGNWSAIAFVRGPTLASTPRLPPR